MSKQALLGYYQVTCPPQINALTFWKPLTIVYARLSSLYFYVIPDDTTTEHPLSGEPSITGLQVAPDTLVVLTSKDVLILDGSWITIHKIELEGINRVCLVGPFDDSSSFLGLTNGTQLWISHKGQQPEEVFSVPSEEIGISSLDSDQDYVCLATSGSKATVRVIRVNAGQVAPLKCRDQDFMAFDQSGEGCQSFFHWADSQTLLVGWTSPSFIVSLSVTDTHFEISRRVNLPGKLMAFQLYSPDLLSVFLEDQGLTHVLHDISKSKVVSHQSCDVKVDKLCMTQESPLLACASEAERLTFFYYTGVPSKCRSYIEKGPPIPLVKIGATESDVDEHVRTMLFTYRLTKNLNVLWELCVCEDGFPTKNLCILNRVFAILCEFNVSLDFENFIFARMADVNPGIWHFFSKWLEFLLDSPQWLDIFKALLNLFQMEAKDIFSDLLTSFVPRDLAIKIKEGNPALLDADIPENCRRLVGAYLTTQKNAKLTLSFFTQSNFRVPNELLTSLESSCRVWEHLLKTEKRHQHQLLLSAVRVRVKGKIIVPS